MITFTSLAAELDNLLTYIDSVRSGKTVYWFNPTTGERHPATVDENLSYIEDQVLLVAAGVNILKDELKNQVSKFTD